MLPLPQLQLQLRKKKPRFDTWSITFVQTKIKTLARYQPQNQGLILGESSL
jgi:hypothetical protein